MGGQLACVADPCHTPRQWSTVRECYDDVIDDGVHGSQSELCLGMCGSSAPGSGFYGELNWQPQLDPEANLHVDMVNNGLEVQWADPIKGERKTESIIIGLESPSKHPCRNAPMKEVLRPNDKDQFMDMPPRSVFGEADEPSPEPDVLVCKEDTWAEVHPEKTVEINFEPALHASTGTPSNLAAGGVAAASSEKELVRSSSSSSSTTMGSDKCGAPAPQRSNCEDYMPGDGSSISTTNTIRQEHSEVVTDTTPEAIAEGDISVQSRTDAWPLPQHGCAKDPSTAACENVAFSSPASEASLPAAPSSPVANFDRELTAPAVCQKTLRQSGEVKMTNAGGDNDQKHSGSNFDRELTAPAVCQQMQHQNEELQTSNARGVNDQAHSGGSRPEKQGSAARSLSTEAYGLKLYHISTTNAAGAASRKQARKGKLTFPASQEKQQRRIERKSASMESLHPDPVKKSSDVGQQHGTEREGRSGRARRPLAERRRADELLLW